MSQRDTNIRTLSALKAQIKALEEHANTIQDALIADLFEQGATEHVIPGEVTVRIQNRRSTTISRELLIAHGVDPDVVTAATKETVSAPFLRLYPVKAGE